MVLALVDRAKSLCWDSLHVREIYSYNEGSRRLFTSLGFQESGKTKLGYSYTLIF